VRPCAGILEPHAESQAEDSSGWEREPAFCGRPLRGRRLARSLKGDPPSVTLAGDARQKSGPLFRLGGMS
jgi:hypothetical protein